MALKRPGQLVAVDNTFATPFFQQPIVLGADIVVHSTTKYLNGYSDVVGGIVITDDAELHRDVAFLQNCMGAIPGPWDSYLTVRGAKTRALRMHAHERNAQAIAEFLRERVDVAQVHYPGLKTHPQHELARRWVSGFGGTVSFATRRSDACVRGCPLDEPIRLSGFTRRCGIADLPSCDDDARLAFDESALRGRDYRRSAAVSVGIENLDDLIPDLGAVLDTTIAQVDPPRSFAWP